MTHRSEWPPIGVGTILDMAERDYIFGAGPLRLLVTHIPDDQGTLGDGWMCLHGIEIDGRGVEVQGRRVMVRVTAIEHHLKGLQVVAHGAP